MKAALAVVGSFLMFDAAVTWMVLLLWGLQGHRPDFLELSVSGVLSVVMVLLKGVVGVLAALQLFKLNQMGRTLAAVVCAYNAIFSIGAAIEAARQWEPTVWVMVGLYLAMLVIVSLPLARDACDTGKTRPIIRPRGPANARRP